MMYRYSICMLIMILGLGACTKQLDDLIDEETPNGAISATPIIDSLALNTTSIQEYSDSLVLSFYFLDGDGDLGTNEADSTVIEVVDNRLPNDLIFNYHLSPRAPDGANVAVQGTLNIVLKNIIRLDSNNASETTTFSIRIKDRAQNWSNILVSPQVTINQ